MNEIELVYSDLDSAKRRLWRRIEQRVEILRQEGDITPAGQVRAELVFIVRANALLEAHRRGEQLDPDDWSILSELVGVEMDDGTVPGNALEVAQAIGREAAQVARREARLQRIRSIAKSRIKAAGSVAELEQIEADARDALTQSRADPPAASSSSTTGASSSVATPSRRRSRSS
jgi:hypothetical protein